MTSNHPERLDPALIRPGRVDKQVFLSYIGPREAAQMIAHYFGVDGLSAAQRATIETVLGASGLVLTPAQCEQQCAEHETIDAMLAHLARALEEAS